ncbi:phage tail tube assembly chaperone [Lactococcus garvieae]|uniref:Phage tail assembly chaperone protein, TAC n=1 Tax=Lactococcus garvieae TaxID=1363 RepID=A0A1I4I465_9LACT|nr:phage tail tube assembly chaperone [Lactococcus garvieae]SFL49258.1 Phage tail assembly chaperone protein, TAC [Lactococcus garvieae]
MIEEQLIERLPKEPTVKQVRLALKFGKDFAQMEKMRTNTTDDVQSMDCYLEVIDSTVEFIKVILKLKPKETSELEEWTMERLIGLAFTLFYKLVNPTGVQTESSLEEVEKK